MIELKRSSCAILPLVLKGKWFDMIERGEKREEYRMATDYWLKRRAKSNRIADSLKAGGMIYTFGTGHGHLLALEVFQKASYRPKKTGKLTPSFWDLISTLRVRLPIGCVIMNN